MLARLQNLSQARNLPTFSFKATKRQKNSIDARFRPKHCFEVDQDDHCETSGAAYDDISPLLSHIAVLLGKERKDLMIYDPYYCNGSVIKHLAARGFETVYNKNEDFYRMIDENRVPTFDVCVTNPPFSGDHIEKLLQFCSKLQKPFFCLMPNYVYTKPYYAHLTDKLSPFYVVAQSRYEFWTPRGFRDNCASEHKTSPFVSFWYCHGGEFTSKLIRWWRKREMAGCGEETPAFVIQNLRYLPQRVRATYDPLRKRLRKKQRISIKLKAARSNKKSRGFG